MYYLAKIKDIETRGRAYYITDYNGNSDYFPQSTVVIGYCNEVYIKKWILSQKSITYTAKKEYVFVGDQIREKINVVVTEHVPEKVAPVDNNTIKRLKRC